MTAPILKIARLPHAADLPLPAYKSAGAAGLDLPAAVPAAEPVVIPPGERRLIGTGFSIAVPEGHEAQVRPRSGLAVEYGLSIVNAPGTVDADYRGEIKVLLVNLGDRPVTINRGMRIAQLVIGPVARADIVEISEAGDLGTTQRGSRGFGSTGFA
jgi:dUTP pyrophosphatase